MNAKAVLTSGLLSIYCNYAIVWTTIVENLLHKNFGDTINKKYGRDFKIPSFFVYIGYYSPSLIISSMQTQAFLIFSSDILISNAFPSSIC